jgi:hypothetical protein
MSEYRFQPTPNPNSIKITHAGAPFLEGGMESFGSADQAAGHALGRRLFAVPGVANVFALPQFVTVTKDPAADWDDILPAVEAALDDYFVEKHG